MITQDQLTAFVTSMGLERLASDLAEAVRLLQEPMTHDPSRNLFEANSLQTRGTVITVVTWRGEYNSGERVLIIDHIEPSEYALVYAYLARVSDLATNARTVVPDSVEAPIDA